jgi:hypothetical protein
VVNDGVGDGRAVEGGGAATELVKNHDRPFGGVMENRSRLRCC